MEELTSVLPQKRHYRQRAHTNPISDHSFDVPTSPVDFSWNMYFTREFDVKFVDIGCGYGGLLFALSDMFPDVGIIGFEIRVKVSDYVKDKIKAMRELHDGKYENIACIRSNAMKYLPNFFRKGQLEKMFFLYPDPHFKRSKHKWRIINETLLAEYAYVLTVNGIVYLVTDVKEVYDWSCGHFDNHPLFARVSKTEMSSDPVVKIVTDCTEEGKKVTRNEGDKYLAVFRRISYNKK